MERNIKTNTKNEVNKNNNLNSNNTMNSIVINKNNNNPKINSSLKLSSTKIKKIKNQIMEIFNDNITTDKIVHYKIDNNPLNIIDNFNNKSRYL